MPPLGYCWRKYLTSPAEYALQLAASEASGVPITTVHILIGIIKTPSDFGSTVVRRICNAGFLLHELQQMNASQALHLMPQQNVISAFQAAEVCESGDYVGTGHLLLGVVMTSEGPLKELLTRFQLSLESIERELENLRGGQHAVPCSLCGSPATVHMMSVAYGVAEENHYCARCAPMTGRE